MLDFIWKILTWGSPSYQWDKGRKKTAIVQLVLGLTSVGYANVKVQKMLAQERERQMDIARKGLTYDPQLQKLVDRFVKK